MADHSKIILHFHDYSDEKSNASFRGAVVAEAALLAAKTALKAAVEAVTEDTAVQVTSVLEVDEIRGTKATEPSAQRERKWLIVGVGADGTSFRSEIPCADLSHLSEAAPEEMDISAGVGAALKSAVEGYCTTKSGSAVTVTAIRHVGRNN